MNRPIRLAIITAAAFFGASCEPSRSLGDNSKPIRVVGSYAVTPNYVVAKFCDAGRAVYVTNGPNGTAIAVVPDAPECAVTP